MAAPSQTLRPIGDHLGPVVVGLDAVMARKAGKTVIQNIADRGGWEAPEQDGERYRMLEAALASRGMPYQRGGGEGAHDAWSLAKACATFATGRDGIDVERIGMQGTSIEEARKALTQWGMSEVRLRHATPGDVLLFDMPAGKLRGGLVYGSGIHAAILSEPGGEMSWAMLPGRKSETAKAVHASWGRSVGETWLGDYWTDKLIAAFSFDAPKPSLRSVMARAA